VPASLDLPYPSCSIIVALLSAAWLGGSFSGLLFISILLVGVSIYL